MSSSFWNVSSVIFPDGTISQTWRGASSCFASARSVFAVEPTFGSNVFISMPVLLEALRHPRAHPPEAHHS